MIGDWLVDGPIIILETPWRHYDICMSACVFEFVGPTKTRALLFRFAFVSSIRARLFRFRSLLFALLFAFYLHSICISRSNEREPILYITLRSGWRQLLWIVNMDRFWDNLGVKYYGWQITLYHRFRWYTTLENKTLAETFPKFPSILSVIDMSNRIPPITASWHDVGKVRRSHQWLWLVDFHPTCRQHVRLTEILETFPQVVCFLKSRINENGGNFGAKFQH